MQQRQGPHPPFRRGGGGNRWGQGRQEDQFLPNKRRRY